MESPIVSCEIEGRIATIVMDDGKLNVISPRMLKALGEALDRAEKAGAVVLLTGREDVLSAGFDLNILRSGVTEAFAMITGGFELAARLLAFPTPVVIANSGHAMAMGAFLLLSSDYSLGAAGPCEAGPYKIVTNEVAIGLTMPQAGIEICRQRLAPAHFVRAAVLAEVYDPESAVEAGFLDRVVPTEDLAREAAEAAARLAELDMQAHRETKLRARRQLLKALRRGLRSDRVEFVAKGVQRMLGSSRKK